MEKNTLIEKHSRGNFGKMANELKIGTISLENALAYSDKGEGTHIL